MAFFMVCGDIRRVCNGNLRVACRTKVEIRKKYKREQVSDNSSDPLTPLPAEYPKPHKAVTALFDTHEPNRLSGLCLPTA